MLVRIVSSSILTAALFITITGCGGKPEVKKNEGVIVNTMPGAAGGPGGAAPSGGAAGGGAAPATPTAQAPPVAVPGSK